MKDKSISLNEAIDRDIGKKGTIDRDKFDSKLKRELIKDTSNRPTLIITGIVIILAIAEIIHFAVYWGIKF